MQKIRAFKIIEVLGKSNTQSFAELRKSTKLGTESIVLGLKELTKKNFVKKDDVTKKYTLQTGTKNKTLLLLRDNKSIINLDPNIFKELKDCVSPFEAGYNFLRTCVSLLLKLTVAQNFPKLTSFEKLEFKELINHYNQAIKKTFDVLYGIDTNQADAIRKALDFSLQTPYFELQQTNRATRRQKLRVDKITRKIEKYVHTN